jgi:hypothetical protein
MPTLTTEPLILRAPAAADFPAFARLLASDAQRRARRGMRRPMVLTGLPLRPAWPRADTCCVTLRLYEVLPVGITRRVHRYDK